MKAKYKTAIIESVPYLVVLIVIGLALYLNALIVQDSITQNQAEIIGYALLIFLIGAEVFSLFWLKVIDVEKRQLLTAIETKDKKIAEFERELLRLKQE